MAYDHFSQEFSGGIAGCQLYLTVIPLLRDKNGHDDSPQLYFVYIISFHIRQTI
jgi:hypothetical protein